MDTKWAYLLPLALTPTVSRRIKAGGGGGGGGHLALQGDRPCGHYLISFSFIFSFVVVDIVAQYRTCTETSAAREWRSAHYAMHSETLQTRRVHETMSGAADCTLVSNGCPPPPPPPPPVPPPPPPHTHTETLTLQTRRVHDTMSGAADCTLVSNGCPPLLPPYSPLLPPPPPPHTHTDTHTADSTRT